MDIHVTASRGLANNELERIEPFDLRQLRRYEPALVAGWIAEEPTLTLAACFELARGDTLSSVGRALAAFLPADTHGGPATRRRSSTRAPRSWTSPSRSTPHGTIRGRLRCASDERSVGRNFPLSGSRLPTPCGSRP